MTDVTLYIKASHPGVTLDVDTMYVVTPGVTQEEIAPYIERLNSLGVFVLEPGHRVVVPLTSIPKAEFLSTLRAIFPE